MVALQDYQVQLPDGTVVGAGTPIGLDSITGLRSLAPVRSGDAPRPQTDGTVLGLSLLGARAVVFTFRLAAPAGGLEAALATLAANWTNVRDPDTVAMTGASYLTGLAAPGGKPVSALYVKLPGRTLPLMLLGKPSKYDVPIDANYQYEYVLVTCEWTIPDGALYDAGAVSSGATPLGQATSGLSWPAPFPWSFGHSTGGTAFVTNAGAYDARLLIKFTGSVNRPRLTDMATGRYIQINLQLVTGDVLTVDTANLNVTLNGASRNNAVDAGSSFLTAPPGQSTYGFTSADANLPTGTATVLLLSTYSTI